MSVPVKGFLALPAELRNAIYELAFAFDSSEPVNLCRATPPSKPLLSTCRQVFNEAAGIYRDAYKSYWSKTTFIVDRRTHKVTQADKARIREYNLEDVQHIRHISITAVQSNHQASSIVARTQLLDARGLWKSTTAPSSTQGPPGHKYWVVRGNKTRTCATESAARELLSSPRFAAISLRQQILDALRMYERWERIR